MQLKLERPLVVLDLETTGTNPRLDRIVELAAVKLFPDGRRESWVKRINPQRAIPAEASAIHGISDADVAAAPTFAEIAFDLQRFLANADFSGFGVLKFDLPLLTEEFRRVGATFNTTGAGIIDVQRIYHLREPRTLSAALQFYCGKEHTGAHGAQADVLATIDVLEGQFARYADLPREAEGLKLICQPVATGDMIDAGGRLKWRGSEVIIGFGQKAGMTLRDMVRQEPGYLRWMLNKDFPAEVKTIIQDAMDGKFAQRPASAVAAPPAATGDIQEELNLLP